MSKFTRESYKDFATSKDTVVEKRDAKEDFSAPVKEIAKELASKSATQDKKIPQMAKTIPDLTNVRKEASTSSDIVKTVAKGAEFKVDLEKSTKEFVAVSVQGEIAFIKRELVQVYDNPAYTSNAVSKIG